LKKEGQTLLESGWKTGRLSVPAPAGMAARDGGVEEQAACQSGDAEPPPINRLRGRAGLRVRRQPRRRLPARAQAASLLPPMIPFDNEALSCFKGSRAPALGFS
jgi:hypothetical protein